MSLQDRVVDKALEQGLTSQDFHKGAQSNANSSWLFLIVTAAVFYFQSWEWAIIPGVLMCWSIHRSISATKVAMRLENLEK